MGMKQKTLVSLIFFLGVTSYITYQITLNRTYFKTLTYRPIFSNDSNDTIDTINLSNQPRIFCLLLTSKNNFKTKAKVLYDVWANKCDNLKFLSLKPDELLSNISNNQSFERRYLQSWLEPVGLKEDRYDKLTNKMYLSIRQIYKIDPNYDWYLKADDDTFIFVDNLRKFLSDKNSSEPVTYGYDFKILVNKGYHSGGAGYLLSKEAFKRIGSKLNENFKFCPNSGIEDVDVAQCLRNLDVFPKPSVDEQGRERFHPLSLLDHFSGNFPDWLHQYSRNLLKKGIDCCSDNSISFHYMSREDMLKAKKSLEQIEPHSFTFKSFFQIFNKF